ncbi:thrombopoietin receptor [Trichomycterus rosablanca]|uniref:thrombopoietin receptor n=1 Tax=Trichomycterus rosablanca TaxID=2290929 RepID=UPI002F35581C
MDLKLTWASLLFCLITQMNCLSYLTKQDQALLSDQPDPKCFTTDLTDFTCFWESLGDKSYDFVYTIDNDETSSTCNISQQETEEGEVLHICFFLPADVYMFVPVDIKVKDKDTNTTIYNSTLHVEDQVLPNPPSNVSLHPTGAAGEMLVRCHVTNPLNTKKILYELRYSSNESPDEVVQLSSSKCEHKLPSLVPGQMCTLQMRIKLGLHSDGHWSDWSAPVSAMVAQSADDIELQCHTSDLHQVQCHWKEGLYGETSFYYKQKNRDDWDNWKICGQRSTSGIQCVLYGEEQTIFEVYVTAQSEHYNRTFYMNPFTMNKSIKTDAPQGLKEEMDGGRLCLSWISPLQQISQHLMYQVRYQLQGETEWKLFTVESPKTKACLDVQVSGQYAIQVKAMPNGSFYSGHWSAWSKALMVQLPSNTGLLFIAIIPFFLLIGSIALITTFPRYVGKLKQFLWPPVPDLNDMLESFLKDISGRDWEPKISNKLCDDDIPASVVEIMPSKEFQIMSKPSNCPYYPVGCTLADLGTGEHSADRMEMNREYVTIKINNALIYPTGNDYVYTVNDQLEDRLCCCSSCCSVALPASTNLLNQSYLQAELGGIHTPTGYTNLENTGTIKAE